MSLFQNSVVNKYLNEANHAEIQAAYQKLVAYFHNSVIQQNIRESKEEQFQEGFLRELFVHVLGYTINPDPDYNLTTEFKNERGARKADGAIVRGSMLPRTAIGVIELKSTTTKDLESIRLQAFDYKANHSKCVYVVTSNFEKLRFYINDAVDFEEFDLFTIAYEQFRLLWLCLAKTNLLRGIPLDMKEASLVKEEDITKQIYIDYTAFKRDLYNDLIANNLGLEIFNGMEEKKIKLLLFKRSQKLLDRFLFLFFGEDRGLLPPNSVSEIIGQWENQSDWGDDVRLYSRFKKYFGLLNTGWKGKKYEIFAYNGGLFAPDEVLDKVNISDDILKRHTQILTTYDFESDVDVNILGHIFENSLNEIEEITAQILSETMEHPSLATQRTVSKRKRDGVFYTPKYITKYIVENTLGILCTEKRAELGIDENEYLKSRKGRTTKKLKELDDKLTDYRNWLLSLTICDPACGSGAFLNQALDFLIREHRYIDELRAKLLDVPMIFTEVENSILENNIYGVDINDESVEIAKLSLWLRTAQKGRKLTSLNNNIKCGNSLIDNPELAGEKAFNWQKEFPNIFRQKEKKAWHITTATHNSRYSQRMFDCHVEVGKAEWMDKRDELVITETIRDIVIEDKLNVLEYNVCGDHLHLLLVCEKEEVAGIVGKLKSMSAKNRNRERGYTVAAATATMATATTAATTTAATATTTGATTTAAGTRGHAPLSGPGTGTPRRGATQRKLWTQKFGKSEINDDGYLNNAIAYISNNRKKHGLPENVDVEKIKKEFLCTREHAFRTEYKGGFDVVIGNPPYVQLQTMGEMSDKLKSCGYETFDKGADLYCLFTERGYKLLRDGGLQSFIMPNKWMLVAYGKPLRKFLSKTGLRQVLNFGDVQFFEEATTYVCIFVVQKSGPSENVKVLSLNKKTYHGDFPTEVKANLYDYSSYRFGENEWSIQPYNDFRKLEQMKSNSTKLKDLPISIFRGILTGYNDAFYIDAATREKLIAADAKSDEIIKPMIRGRDVLPYGISDFEYLISTYPALKLDIEDYPAVKEHLLTFGYDRLKQTGDKGSRKKTSGEWFETQDSINYYEHFSKPKIMYPNMTSVFPFMYDESWILGNQKCFILTANDDSVSLLFLTAVFNSSLAKLWIWYNCPELQGGTREISKVYFEHFPVPQASQEQQAELAQFAKERTQLTNDFQTLTSKFVRSIQRKFNFEKMTTKMQNWYSLSYAEFIKELSKKKIKLSLSEEAEWEEYFLQESVKVLALKSKIDTTDKEIDKMVYELYGVGKEEIEVAKESG